MKYTPEKIFDLYQGWRKLYNENNLKAFKAAAFENGDQWSDELRQSRERRNKQCLVFNEIAHIAKMVESEISSFDYGIKIIEHSVKDLNKIKIAQKIFEHILLSDVYKTSFSQGIIKACMFGYSVAEVVLEDENDFTMQQIPKVKFMDNPEFAFFDPIATKPYKEDSKYCGMKRQYRASTIRQNYGNHATEEDDDTIVDVIFFYYKEAKSFKFYQLKNGQYKREDKVRKGEKLTHRSLQKNIDIVHSMIVTENKILKKPDSLRSEYKGFYTSKLPLIFFGKTKRYHKINDNTENELKEGTSPFSYPLIDTQISLNIAASEICTSAEHQSKRKFFALPHQVNANEDDFRNINDLDGTIVIGDQRADETYMPGQPVNPQTTYPQVVEPERFPSELLHVITTYRQMMNELAGINVSQQGAAEDRSVSGAAVNARIAQGSIIHQALVQHFNGGVNYIGQMLKELFPLVIKGEYPILDQGQEIAVLNRGNKDQGDLIDSIEALNEDYDFTIEALPISRIEKEKSLSALISLSTNKPQLDPYLLDKIFKNLDFEDSQELQRRFEVMVPDEIYQAGQGLINREQYSELMVKKQQEAAKQQQQQAQMQVQPMMEDIKMRERMSHEKNEIQKEKNSFDAYEKEKKLKLEQYEAKVNLKARELEQDKYNQKLALENQKLQHEQTLEKMRLEIEREKLDLEKQKLLLEQLQHASE